MSNARTMGFIWNGEAMHPRIAGLAARSFEKGRVYLMDVVEQRSRASHDHYFATVADLWANLPEGVDFATPEHLRKFALIKSGWHDSRSIGCASKAEAQRVAAFVKPMDDFAIVTVTGALVTVYTAKSQKIRLMGKADFQKSKDDVLGVIAAMIGVDRPVSSPELVPA